MVTVVNVHRVGTGERAAHVDQPMADESLTLTNVLRQEVADDGAGLPRDFDWQAYLNWHPELERRGVATEDAAKEHYLRHGRAEGRLYKRYCTVMLFYPVPGENRWCICNGHRASALLSSAAILSLTLQTNAMVLGAVRCRSGARQSDL